MRVADEDLFRWMRDNSKEEDRVWSCCIFDENRQNILYNLHFIIEIKGESQSEFIEERKNCVNDFRCFRRSLWNCYSYVCEVFDWFYAERRDVINIDISLLMFCSLITPVAVARLNERKTFAFGELKASFSCISATGNLPEKSSLKRGFFVHFRARNDAEPYWTCLCCCALQHCVLPQERNNAFLDNFFIESWRAHK